MARIDPVPTRRDFGGFRLFGLSATTLALIAGGVYLLKKKGVIGAPRAAAPAAAAQRTVGPTQVATTPQGAVPALLTPSARSAQMRQNIRAKLPVNNVGRA